MADSLYLGSDNNKEHQANGVIQMAQAGFRLPSTSERVNFFERTTEPRMSRAARWFAQLDDNLLSYKRAAADAPHSIEMENNYGDQDEDAQSVALRITIHQDGAGFDDTFFIDNTRFWVSNILWEFSPDEGITWYPMFDILPEVWTRMVLPYPTDTVRVRATSNNLTDWLQAFTLKPTPHYEPDAVL